MNEAKPQLGLYLSGKGTELAAMPMLFGQVLTPDGKETLWNITSIYLSIDGVAYAFSSPSATAKDGKFLVSLGQKGKAVAEALAKGKSFSFAFAGGNDYSMNVTVPEYAFEATLKYGAQAMLDARVWDFAPDPDGRVAAYEEAHPFTVTQ